MKFEYYDKIEALKEHIIFITVCNNICNNNYTTTMRLIVFKINNEYILHYSGFT